MKAGEGHPDYFSSGSIVYDLQSTNKYDAIREIIRRAPVFDQDEGLDADRFVERVIEREKLQSTGFGHGVAVAHGRTTDVRTSRIALGVSRDGISFDAIDGQPVHLLFIVANHPDHQMDYLRILSTLVSLVRDDDFRRELLCCSKEEDVQRKLFEAFASRLPAVDIASNR